MMNAEVTRYQFDQVEVRPSLHEVLREGKALSLEPKAFRVLLYLIEHRERAVSKEELIEAVWKGTAVTDNALTRIVAQLRRELGDDARQARYIQTLPTLGYRFIGEIQSPEPPAAAGPAAPRRSRRLWWVAGALVLSAGLAAWISHSPDAAPPNLLPVQITTSPGLDVGGSFSPDGNSFAYSSNRSGKFEIYSRPLGPNGAEKEVTSDGSQNIEPAWSPDGKTIAYHSVGRHGVWVIPEGGGEPRQVSSFGSSPAWSPDGRKLAFRSLEPYSFAQFDLAGMGDSTIWTVSADGSGLQRLTNAANPAGQHLGPNWSPDGRKVLFATLGHEYGLWAVDTISGALQAVAAAGVPFRVFPVFAPDGRGLFFLGYSGAGSPGLYYQKLAGNARPVQIFSTRQEVPLQIAIAPDGRRLLATSAATTSQLWRIGSDATSPEPLYTDAVIRAKLPSFSPDGRKLAYIAQRAGSLQDLWMMNADGSGAAAVAAEPGTEEGPFWNANGSAILYSYIHQGVLQMRRIRPGDNKAQVLLSSKELLHRPEITPDERSLIYETGMPMNIWIRPLDGGVSRQLTFDREGARFHVLSHDGRWIAYEVSRGDSTQIALMDLEGGHIEELTNEPGHYWSNSWASDNRRIASAAFRDGVWNIYWIDRVTRKRRQLTHYTAFGSFVRNPAWRPGTEEIVYEYSQIKGNIYLLDLSGCCR